MAENSPADARITGSILGMGRFHILLTTKSGVPQLPSQCTLEPVLYNKGSH